MDPRYRGGTPPSGSGSSSGRRGRGSGGSGRGSGGSGGQWMDTSGKHRRRMPSPSTGTSLIKAFNAAAGGGDGTSYGKSSSSGGFDLGLDESHPRYNRHSAYPEVFPNINRGRLHFNGSPRGSPPTDDDVLVMDGVLVPRGSASGCRRATPSFNVHGGSPGSGGGRRYSSNRQRQVVHGRDGNVVVRATNPRFAEVGHQSGRSVHQISGYNMQGGPRTYQPSLPGAAYLPHAAAPYGAAPIPIRPPAPPYYTPPRAAAIPPRAAATPPRAAVTPHIGDDTIPPTAPRATATPPRAAATPHIADDTIPPTAPRATATPPIAPSSPRAPKKPEAKLPSAQRAAFTWPPTEEEEAAISQWLYGPRHAQRRLPVFEIICPS